MKIGNFALTVALLLLAQGFALAGSQLDNAEILQIFKTLTSHPSKTWIPIGTIEATHREYKSSNGYVIDSNVVVRYDGEKFYWEINVYSHVKQTEPLGNLHSKSSRDDFDLNWNRRRIFAWDGERYTMYFRPGNHAIVTEGPSDIPVTVNGPLTAGIVPWGYGAYTLESLSAAESSAEVDEQGQVHLTLNQTNMPEMVFILDPAKDYAVLSCLINHAGGLSVTKTYGNYELIFGRWVPTTIIIERYDDSKQSPELLSLDYWNLTSISVSLPAPDSFSVPYETDALVEFYSPITDEPLSYRYYSEVDTDSLLQERLAVVSTHDTQTQNCATAAMKYIAEQLGRDVNDQKLAELVSGPNKSTSLYSLQRFARELGFHCLAVKTDIQALKNLKACQAILHLPGPNHYVVFEYIDDEYVWIIDLDSNKFFYRTRLDEFDLDWSEGTALLISNEPLNLKSTYTELGDNELQKIVGSAGGGFSCTDLFQEYDVLLCPPPIGELCGGRYRIWYNRYACEPDPEGGTCTGTGMVGNVSSPCINDPEDPLACIITGEWFSQYIRACN